MSESKLSPFLQSARDSINRAIEGMSDDDLTWHPEGKWSAAEILEHLSLAYSRTVGRMNALLQQDRPEARQRTVREWAGRMMVLKVGHIPAGRKAPEALVPKGMKPEEAKVSITRDLNQLNQAIDQCEKRFGSRQNIMVHTILGPLSTREWRKFHCVHTLHHMRQIERLRRRMRNHG